MAKFCPEANTPSVSQNCLECEEKTCKYLWLLVVGSRSITNADFVFSELDKIVENRKDVFILSGGAAGVDTLAIEYAKKHNFPYKIMKAEWNKYGKAAGFIRNRKMHELISKVENRCCVAFWDGISKGTEHNFRLSEEYHTKLAIIKK
jgi:hypothetical protein